MKRLILLIIVVGVLCVAGLGAWTYSDLHKPIAHTKTGQYIDIPKGTSPSAIVQKLATEGIIAHEWPLKLYLKATGKGSTLKAGEYDFPSPISPLAALAKLQQGERRLNRITIIEGWTRWDIAALLARKAKRPVQLLLDRGWRDEDVRKLLGGNAMRVMQSVLDGGPADQPTAASAHD